MVVVVQLAVEAVEEDVVLAEATVVEEVEADEHLMVYITTAV